MLVNMNVVMVFEVSCAFVCVYICKSMCILMGELIQVFTYCFTMQLYPWLTCVFL